MSPLNLFWMIAIAYFLIGSTSALSSMVLNYVWIWVLIKCKSIVSEDLSARGKNTNQALNFKLKTFLFPPQTTCTNHTSLTSATKKSFKDLLLFHQQILRLSLDPLRTVKFFCARPRTVSPFMSLFLTVFLSLSISGECCLLYLLVLMTAPFI